MTGYWQLGSWKLRIASSFFLCGAIAPSGNCAFAQITPDITLGNESSTVTSTGAVDSINGGAARGANLFHSFQEFNVGEGRAAVFTNPAGIENILTRVTGANPSNIFGTLGVAGGSANLFLINPKGIIFGRNASLNIGGSFVATTANAIGFGNQGFFSATNPSNSSMLTVNPSALLFNQIRAAAIENNSVAPSGLNPSSQFTATGLRVPDGNSLLLVGGGINMDGGGLYAFGGRVELEGLAGTGIVGLNGNGNNLSLSFPNSVERSDVSLSNGALVDVTAGDGGSITVTARNLEMTQESGLLAGIESGLSSEKSKAGNIEVNATGAVNLNGSRIFNDVQTEANGQGGDVSISASKLQVVNGQVSASTLGAGKGGNLRVVASDVQLIGIISTNNQIRSGLLVSALRNSTGDAGDLTIQSNTLQVQDGAVVGTGTLGAGKGGDLTIQTNTLQVQDGATVSSGTFGAGKGGNLRVDASDVQLIGTNEQIRSTGLFSSANFNSIGDAGDLTINTNTLRVQDGAQVGAGTFGTGKGGNLRIDASDVQLVGTSVDGQTPSGLFARAGSNSTGDAGDLSVNTNTLQVQDGAQVSASTLGAGKGGDLTINTNTLQVQDGAEVTVESLGTGIAGNMTLNSRSVRLNNNALLSADTQSALVESNSEQATININSQDLIISRNSNIFTNATGKNVIGGNININSDIIAALENSDISTNSANFRGGNVRINASAIFGTQFRDVASDRTSDITATGASPEFSGTVELDTLDLDPNSGLINLPAIPVDTQVAQTCTPGSTQSKSEFVVTGRGGLPPSPDDTLSSDAIQVDWVTLNPKVENPSSPDVSTNPTAPHPVPIVEAQGWVIDNNGEIVLTASASTATPNQSWQTPANCHTTRNSS